MSADPVVHDCWSIDCRRWTTERVGRWCRPGPPVQLPRSDQGALAARRLSSRGAIIQRPVGHDSLRAIGSRFWAQISAGRSTSATPGSLRVASVAGGDAGGVGGPQRFAGQGHGTLMVCMAGYPQPRLRAERGAGSPFRGKPRARVTREGSVGVRRGWSASILARREGLGRRASHGPSGLM